MFLLSLIFLNSHLFHENTRAIGCANQILTIVSSVSLGMYYFHICFLLREAILLNIMLINVEVWGSVSDQQINVLHKSDVSLMLKFYGIAHKSTGEELLYLEAGKVPLKFIVSKRRLMYLWHILTRNPNELISKVYNSQKLKPVKGDFYSMIQQDKQTFNMCLTDEQISNFSKKKFKKLVYESVDKFAFKFLLERGAIHSKSKNIVSTLNKSKLKTQPYLLCEEFSREEAQLCFRLRTRALDIKNNFKSKYKDDLSCRTCDSGLLEDEQHLLLCSGLQIEDDVSSVKYDDIFSDLKSQIKTTKMYMKILRKREIVLEVKQDQPS